LALLVAAKTNKTTSPREQLEEDIEPFLNKRYVSLLTLLGAAKEIIARLIEEQTSAHPLDETWKP